ncbi:MAG: YraN family protein [Hyphomicrobium sp.]|jgi:putative endonuclease|nr:YraN family protein [Hyphomicrobium sp.]
MTAGTGDARYRTGLRSEWLAAMALRLRGYRILDKRWKSASGEIDLVAVRGRRLAFIEVKHRSGTTDEEAAAAVGDAQRRRTRRAAELWVARHRAYREYEIAFHLVLVAPRRWPRIIEDGL